MTTPAADGPVWRDRGVIIAQQQTRIAELEAEVERLRALVGDEDQPGWGSLSRAEAIRQANEFHTGQLRWIDEHDKRRAERDEARAALVRVRALGDAFADDGAARYGGNIAWHIEEAIANEKGDFPAAADQRIASQRDRAEAAEADAAGLRARMQGLADEWAECRAGYGVPDPSWSYVEGRLRALAAEPTPAAEPHAEDGA